MIHKREEQHVYIYIKRSNKKKRKKQMQKKIDAMSYPITKLSSALNSYTKSV